MRNLSLMWLAVLVVASGCSIFQTDATSMDPMIDAIYASGKQAIAADKFVEADWLVKCMDMLKVEQSIVANRGKLPEDINSFKDKRDIIKRYNETLKEHLKPADFDRLRELRRKYHYQEYVE